MSSLYSLDPTAIPRPWSEERPSLPALLGAIGLVIGVLGACGPLRSTVPAAPTECAAVTSGGLQVARNAEGTPVVVATPSSACFDAEGRRVGP